MPEKITDLLEHRSGEQYELHTDYINPVFVKMLKTIGFDKKLYSRRRLLFVGCPG